MEYAPFKEEFANQIGKYNVDKIEEIKDLYLYDFGIFIEVSPDEEEKAMLEQNIQMALSKNDISLEDAIDIREVRNLKMANQLLKLKRKRKQDADREAAAMAQQMTAQTQFQSQQIAAQNAAQKTQLEGEMKMREEQAKIAFEIEKLKNEAALKQELMTYEFQLNMRLKGMEQFQLNDREEKREEAKSKRISQQNTEQSQLINQRKKDLPPINFESKEDSLDGFDLAEFEPR